jgi:ABC-type transporter Mla subunit MlaD
METDKRLYEQIRRVFTDEEIRKLGEDLAQQTQGVIDLRAQKSSTLAALSAQIKSVEQAVSDLTQKINNRCEMIAVEVIAMLDNPRPGMKALVRVDNNEVVRFEAMTSAEMQGSFGFKVDDEPEDEKR